MLNKILEAYRKYKVGEYRVMKSRILHHVYESAKDLHEIGLLDDHAMREFEAFKVVKNKQLKQETLARWQEAKDGKVVSNEAVTKWLDTWGTKEESDKPPCTRDDYHGE